MFGPKTENVVGARIMEERLPLFPTSWRRRSGSCPRSVCRRHGRA